MVLRPDGESAYGGSANEGDRPCERNSGKRINRGKGRGKNGDGGAAMVMGQRVKERDLKERERERRKEVPPVVTWCRWWLE